MLCLGSIEINHGHDHYSYNSFLKFHGKKKLRSHNMAVLYSLCFYEMCYKGTASC